MSDEDIEWTTDMTFPVGNGYDLSDVSKYIESHFENSMDFSQLHSVLCDKFLLHESDADLAIDRALGGIVRALTANQDNEPDSTEDPIANYMFNKVWTTLPTKGFLIRRKVPGGKWNVWNEKRRSITA